MLVPSGVPRSASPIPSPAPSPASAISGSSDEQLAALETALADQDALWHALMLAIPDYHGFENYQPAQLPSSSSFPGQRQSLLSSSSSSPRRARLAFPRASAPPRGEYSQPLTEVSTLPPSHQVVVGLGQELLDIRDQRRTAQGALVRAQRDRLASEQALVGARAALPVLQARLAQISREGEKYASLLDEASRRSLRAEADTDALARSAAEWDARIEALEQECRQVERSKALRAVQIECLRASWDNTKPQWAKQLLCVRTAAEKRHAQRRAELEVVREKTRRMSELSGNARAEHQANLLRALEQWCSQRDQLLAVLRDRVPALRNDLKCAETQGSTASSTELISPAVPSALDQQIDRAISDVRDIIRRARLGQV